MSQLFFFSLVFCLISCSIPNEEKSPANNNTVVTEKEDLSLLQQKIKHADSVFLISHVGYEDIYDHNKKNPNNKYVEGLLINGKPNYSIIKEKERMHKRTLESLISIFSMKHDGKQEEMKKCFDPQHAILLFKHDKVSYIDLCFHCLGYSLSDDIKEMGEFDKAKWQALLNYFKSRGFVYQMPNKIE